MIEINKNMTNKRKRVSKHKDITRIDQESKRTHGWNVRIMFVGKLYGKFFSDKKHGGKDSALKVAIVWRDQTRAKIGKPQSNKHIISVPNNATGIVGVYFNEKLNRYDISWVRPDGQQRKTSVSIRKHGKADAFKLAIQKREEENKKRLNAA